MVMILSLRSFSLIGARAFHRADLNAGRRLAATTTFLSQQQKPVIFLDVDDVINFTNVLGGANISATKRCYSDAKKVKFAVHDGRRVEVAYSPTVVRKINEWSKVAEIHWLTSWGERANKYLAPAIGLKGPFATLPHDSLIEDCLSKVECVEQFAVNMDPNRLVIWIDDMMRRWVRVPDDGGLPSPRSKTCTFCAHKFGSVMTRPNSLYVIPSKGLTPDQLDLVDRHLADPELARDKMIYAETRVSEPLKVFTKDMFDARTPPQAHDPWCKLAKTEMV